MSSASLLQKKELDLVMQNTSVAVSDESGLA